MLTSHGLFTHPADTGNLYHLPIFKIICFYVCFGLYKHLGKTSEPVAEWSSSLTSILQIMGHNNETQIATNAESSVYKCVWLVKTTDWAASASNGRTWPVAIKRSERSWRLEKCSIRTSPFTLYHWETQKMNPNCGRSPVHSVLSSANLSTVHSRVRFTAPAPTVSVLKSSGF